MREFNLIIIICVLINISVFAQISVVPYPNNVIIGNGKFVLSSNTKIKSIGNTRGASELLEKLIQGLEQDKGGIQNTILVKEGKTGHSSDESYKLEVGENQIEIVGEEKGLFYGVQTLLQLIPNKKSDHVAIPAVKILDSPQFSYRGLMLDVSRHFFTVDEIKWVLDLMARYKLNVFHWHLTDDQGWRIEIKSLPKLTEIGARRVSRTGHFGTDMLPPQQDEKADDIGFYTHEQIREIVEYARFRNIVILPEIDMPGHAMAAIASYPFLCVTGDTTIKVNPGSSFARWFGNGQYEMYTDNSLDPTKETTYNFIDQVLSEIADLFPYEYIHIGGDECFKGFWEKSPHVIAFMQRNNIKDMKALQGYFISRLHKIVESKKKKMIGWDEILEGNTNGEFSVMNRFDERTLDEQLSKKHPVILASSKYGLYFDYAQSSSKQEPINHGGNYPWSSSYQYNPLNDETTMNRKDLIRGVEGCIWTEHIYHISKLQYMILPRILGLAETGWTSSCQKNVETFKIERLPYQLAYFDRKGYNYWVPPVFETLESTETGHSFNITFDTAVPDAAIYFTLNGKDPTDADLLAKPSQTIKIMVPKGKVVMLKAIVITSSGRRSIISSKKFIG
ncbi:MULTISPECIES: beta-N-acetylhexosaminidase [Sphingobacterium]|uniref:beta-N-acetylhexosaminidase n=1 Tax=Sphingobacterium TaxID=28453 RepID=UPI0008A3D0CE|nr:MULTISPECIES: family 20 glycosylhydrolase [Sphingobacterium]OFV14367.1 hypothetical protein HMPREF3127_13365 [Sphingobacterium sp. HMSC13C05]